MMRSDDIVYALAALVLLHILLRACAPSPHSRSAVPPGGRGAVARPRSASVSARQAATITPSAWSEQVAGTSGKFILLCDGNGNIERLAVDTLLGDIKAKMGESSTKARDDAVTTAGAATSEIKTWLSSHGGGRSWTPGNWSEMRVKTNDLTGFTYLEYKTHVAQDFDTEKSGVSDLRKVVKRTKDVYLTSERGTECPDGTVEVGSQEECKRAAMTLGGLPGHHAFYLNDNNDGNLKKGCQVIEYDNQRKKRYQWNTSNNSDINPIEWRVCQPS